MLGILMVLISVIPGLVYALNTESTGYQTGTSGTYVYVHSETCQEVSHTGSSSYFVPTNTLSEWNTFKTNKPGDVTLASSCPTPSCGTAPNTCVNGSFSGGTSGGSIVYWTCTNSQYGTSESCSAVGDGDGGSESFLAGTTVETPGGVRSVEDIKKGDLILSSGGVSEVVKLKGHFNKGLVYGFNETGLFVTDGHPFMTTEGWKAFNVNNARRLNPNLDINRLSIGDSLVRSDGSLEMIREIYSGYMEVEVYNFEVSGTNDYYADGYWVHNK